MTTTQRILTTEAAISVVPNALVSALFVWLMFGGKARVPLWGSNGVAFDLVPTTFMLTLMTTIALTLIVRARRRKGLARVPPGAPRLPHNVVLRGIILGLTLCGAFLPVSIGLLWLGWEGDWSYGRVMTFKIVYGVAVGLVATPLAVLAALRD